MEVLADAGQIDGRLDADGLQLPRIADPGQEEELRRFDRAGADDDLAGRVGPVGPAVLEVLDTGAAAVLDDQLRGERIGREGQVRPAEGGLEVRLVGGDALAIDDVDVMPARADHVRAVEVVGGRVAELQAGVDEGARGRVRVVLSRVGQRQRPVLAHPRAGLVLLVLELLEVRKDILVRPAGRAARGPRVVVRGWPRMCIMT